MQIIRNNLDSFAKPSSEAVLLYAITEDLKEETPAKRTVSQSEWGMADLRGIVSNNVSDKDAHDEYLSNKYGL